MFGQKWKLYFIGMCLFGQLSGCKSDTGPHALPPNQPQDSTSASHPPIDTAAGPISRSDTVLRLAFDNKEIPNSIRWEGDLVDGAHWRDRNGDNWLLITEVFQGELSDRSLVAKYFASCYNDISGSMNQYWAIKEVNQDYFSFPSQAKGTLEITDLDKDGIAEESFLYQVEPDGSAPTIVKLMLHVRGKKYAIRGQLAGMDYDRGKVEEKRIDHAFDEINPIFRSFASKKWDRFEKEYYKGWPEVRD